MPNPKKDTTNKQSVSKNIMEKVNTSEDEIDLIDYFSIVWKRKYFIVFGSALPVLIVFLFLFFSPRDYKIAYTYNMRLDEKAFKILEDKFYSTENLEKLVKKLKEAGFDRYAKKLAEPQTTEVLKKIFPSRFHHHILKL